MGKCEAIFSFIKRRSSLPLSVHAHTHTRAHMNESDGYERCSQVHSSLSLLLRQLAAAEVYL